MLSEISHKKTHNVRFHLNVVSGVVKSVDRKMNSSCQGLGIGGSRKLVFSGYKLRFCNMETVLAALGPTITFLPPLIQGI